ncbi:MAG: DUF1552 domain-containing protein [Pirellulales bacterium]
MSEARSPQIPLSRRTVLRGLGAAIALPSLESLQPAVAAAAAAAIPTRMAFLYVPNGVNVGHWKPEGEGRDYRPGPTLEPLAEFRDEFQVISGLAHRNGTAGPDGAGDHARAAATFLTGARPRKTAGADVRAGVSVDQVAANAVGDATRFPSLELSCDGGRKSGNCDSGYSCAYQFNMAWRSATQPVAPESNPRLVFERLFGAGKGAERAASLAARQQTRRSILDFVREDARSLHTRLATADRRKLDEYLAGLRDVERQVARFDAPMPEVPDVDLPAGPPPSYGDHIRLMADMLVLALRTDSTRIATFLLAHDGSNRSFPEIGVGDGHHHLSHHQGNAEMLEKIGRIDRFYAEQFAYILGRMREAREADGRTLLDHSMVVYASGLSDGNRHQHDDLPVILAGTAGGRLAAGRHVVLPAEQPMTNLYLTMLDLVGAPQPAFGDSTGPLDAVRT